MPKKPASPQGDVEQPETQSAQAPVRPLHEIIEDLARGGHAGFAMIAQSRIEDAVRQLVLARLPNFPNLPKTLQNKLFKHYGPFASFSAKIDVAYTMGQISKAVHHDLNVIRDVRNKFAHSAIHLHFGSSEIVALLLGFKDYNKKLDPFVFFKEKIDDCWAAIIPRLKTDALASALMNYSAPQDKPEASPKKSR